MYNNVLRPRMRNEGILSGAWEWEGMGKHNRVSREEKPSVLISMNNPYSHEQCDLRYGRALQRLHPLLCPHHKGRGLGHSGVN